MWFAIPSSQWTCTTYSLPVSRRTGNHPWLLEQMQPRSTLHHAEYFLDRRLT